MQRRNAPMNLPGFAISEGMNVFQFGQTQKVAGKNQNK